MNIKKILVFSFCVPLIMQSLCARPLAEQFQQAGYVELHDTHHGKAAYAALYACFDELIAFLQTNPIVAQKLYSAKERFIRSKDKNYYSTDIVGFYDESTRIGRHQLAFYYSIHFHEFICAHYKELNKVPEISRFLHVCREIQQPYADLFFQAASDLAVEAIFDSDYNRPPILLKIIKYLPPSRATRPHYDGSAFSLFLDSTDNQSLLLSAYKSVLAVDDFSPAIRKIERCGNQNSILLIPGTMLTEFFVNPTPHIVVSSSAVRYATIAFAMRPGYIPTKYELSSLPDFSTIE